MQLDRKNLDRLLKLNDNQLRGVILKLAASKGLDASGLKLGAAELSMIRAALTTAADEDLQRVVAELGNDLAQYGRPRAHDGGTGE